MNLILRKRIVRWIEIMQEKEIVEEGDFLKLMLIVEECD